MKITVNSLPKNGVSINFDAPFSPSTQRHSLIKEILFYAFLNRPAWIVTVEPQKWSLIRSITAEENIISEKIGGKNYRFYFQPMCSAEFLEEVADDDEFFRALLWLIAAPENDKARIYEIISQMDASERLKSFTPTVNTEWLFAGFDYAETVYWFNPLYRREEILQKLDEIARANNCELDTAAV